MIFDELRKRFASYKLPALFLALMLIAVIGAFLAVNTARTVMLRTRTPVPPIVERVPWLAPSYLDRASIQEQVIDSPRLIRALLWPALGSPAVLDPNTYLDVVLDRPHRGAKLALIRREVFAELDQHLYALPPKPHGESLLAAQIAAAKARGDTGSLELMLPEERKAMVAALDDANYQSARSALLARVKNDSGQDVRDAVERFRSGVARIVERDGNALLPLTPQDDCVPLGVGATCVIKVRVPIDTPSGLYTLVLLGPDRKLIDFQMNAAYRPADSRASPSFVVTSDMQWGDAPAIAGAASAE